MPYLRVGEENSASINLYYEDHGQGAPVVLVHGWPLSGTSWEKQTDALLRSGHRVITYDRRGFGQSSKPATGYNYEVMTRDLQTLMRHLDLHNVTLVGFSMGTGEVAHYLGRHGSDRVSRVVFIAPIAPFLTKRSDNPRGVDIEVFEGIKKEITEDRFAFLTRFFSDFYNADVFKGKRISEEVLHDSWIVAAGASPRGTLDCVQAWLTDFRRDLATIDIPTLVIQGDADRILPIDSTGRLLHEIVEGSRLVVCEGAPHGLLWTHAKEVNAELVEFIRGVELQAERRTA